MKYRGKSPVDEGYSWVLLAACYVSYLIVSGILKSFGILHLELQDVYHSTAGVTSSIGSICIFVFSLTCPVAINFGTRYSFRGAMFASGIISGLGFFLSSFVTRIEFVFITYSIIAGKQGFINFMMGAAYAAGNAYPFRALDFISGFYRGLGFALSMGSCVTSVNLFFEKRRGLANGILASGSGVGSFLFPYLYRYLFSTYGLRGAFMVLGGVSLQICVAATILRQPVIINDDTNQEVKYDLNKQSKLTSSKQRNVFCISPESLLRSCLKFIQSSFVLDWRLFKNTTFVLYTLAFICTLVGWSSNFFMLSPHIESVGFTKDEAAFSASIGGLSELCSRILIGWFTDLKLLPQKYIYMTFMVIGGTAEVCVPLSNSYEWLCVYSGIVGVFPGTFYTLLPLLLVEIVGKQRFPSAYGLVTFCIALVSFVAFPALGWLKDYVGSWTISWYIAGALMLCSAALVFLDDCLNGKQKKENDKPAMRDESPDVKTHNNSVSESVHDLDVKRSEEEIPMLLTK